MIYLPTNWLIKPTNENKVRGLLDNLNQDVITEDLLTEVEVILELQKIGETTVIEKLIYNEIALGA